MRGLAVLLVLTTGCATSFVDPAFTCETLRSNPARLDRANRTELYEMAYGTPARPAARSAYLQGKATIGLLVVGGAALVAGFIQGFVADRNTHPEIITSGYALIGTAVGLGTVSLILGITGPRAERRARAELRNWSTKCQGMGP